MSSPLSAPGGGSSTTTATNNKKPVMTRDLRTADSATKVLERATVATSVAQRKTAMGQRMALLGQLSACMAALAAEESSGRSEIIKAKEYALWMGGIAEEEEDLYRDDTVVDTHPNIGQYHNDNNDDDDDFVGSDHSSPTPREEGVSSGGVHPPQQHHSKVPPPQSSTFALSRGAKKTLKDPSFKSKVQRTQEHQAYSNTALRGRSSCLFWPLSHPFNLDTQERNPTTAITSPATFTRSLRCGRPDSALASLRSGKLGRVGGSVDEQPPPASRAVTYRRFFPTDDPQDCNMDPSRAFPSPTATITELKEKCVCLRASVPTRRDHKYHYTTTNPNPSSSSFPTKMSLLPDGLLMMKVPPPSTTTTASRQPHHPSPPSLQPTSSFHPTATTPHLPTSTMCEFSSNLQDYNNSLTSQPHTPAAGVTPTSRTVRGLPNHNQQQLAAPVVTSSAVLEFGVETDLRPRWDGAGSTLPMHLLLPPPQPPSKATAATSPKAAKPAAISPSQTAVASSLSAPPSLIPRRTIPTVAARDEMSLVSREVRDYIHYLADAMDHAASVSAAHRVEGSWSVSPLIVPGALVEPPPQTDPTGAPLTDDQNGGVTSSGSAPHNPTTTILSDEDDEETATAASMIEAAVSEAQRHNKASFNYHLDEDGHPSIDPTTKLTPAGGSESWVDATKRKDHIRAQARAFRVAINKVITDENEQRWELVHAQLAGDKRLFRLFRVDHAKAQRDLLSAQRTQRRDLERLLTLELLKLVVVWEHQHEELYALFRSQHTILKGIAVGRGVLGVEECDARACLDRYEGVAMRNIHRTHKDALSNGLADIQRRYVAGLQQAQRERDELAMKEQRRDEEEELERQSREDERAQRAADVKAEELRRHREAYLHAL